MNGLSIIPEGRSNKDCKKSGYLYEVSNILNLDRYLEYSSKMDLGVLYLSNQKGIIYSDDIVEASTPLYKYSYYKRRVWVSVVVEQIARSCMWYSTRNVYLMIDKIGCYHMLISELRKRGVEVYTPFLGIKR